ncbi:uncharacterized protein BDV17DRAFT_291011 [Aspergillus undulatus]|uniref:uncharacterized protein n=1 Tax=Aspergillus undulatus TaxID=1810928 RepID=UPI003CCDC363
MRRSEKDKRPGVLLLFNDRNNSASFVGVANFIREFPQAAGAVDPYQGSPTDSYIYGDTVLFSPRYDLDWTTVSAEQVPRRLTTAFNTYWQVSLGPFVISSASLFDPVNLTQPEIFGLSFNSTEAQTPGASGCITLIPHG